MYVIDVMYVMSVCNVCMHACMCVCVCVCVFRYVCMYVCMCVRMYVCMCLSVCMYVYMYACHVCICNAYSITCRPDATASEFYEGLDTPVHHILPIVQAPIHFWTAPLEDPDLLDDDFRPPALIDQEVAHAAATAARMECDENAGIIRTAPIHGRPDPSNEACRGYHRQKGAGQCLTLAMGRGGHFRISGPGVQFDGTVGRNVWIRIMLPMAHAVAATSNGLSPNIYIEMDGIVGPLWISGRPTLGSNAPEQIQARGDEACRGSPQRPDVVMPSAVHINLNGFQIGTWLADGLRRAEQIGLEDSCLAQHVGSLQPIPQIHDHAGNAATLILSRCISESTPRLAYVIAGWLCKHISIYLRKEVTRWQWRVTINLLVAYHAGLPSEYASDTHKGHLISRDFGLNVATMRQLPGRLWETGRNGFSPGSDVPGIKSKGVRPFDVGIFQIGEELAPALERLIASIGTWNASHSAGQLPSCNLQYLRDYGSCPAVINVINSKGKGKGRGANRRRESGNILNMLLRAPENNGPPEAASSAAHAVAAPATPGHGNPYAVAVNWADGNLNPSDSRAARGWQPIWACHPRYRAVGSSHPATRYGHSAC